MSGRRLVKELATQVKLEKKNLATIDDMIKKQDLSTSNKQLFMLLSKATRQQKRLSFLEKQLKFLKRNLRNNRIVGFGSKVYLFSTKMSRLLLVDARNYLELVGKTLGDAVVMNNVTFLIAGVS